MDIQNIKQTVEIIPLWDMNKIGGRLSCRRVSLLRRD